MNDAPLSEGASVQPLVTPEALADIQRRIEDRGITVPEQIDWDAVDAETRAEWTRHRLALRQDVWRQQVPAKFVDARVDDFGDMPVELKGADTTVAAALHAWLPTHDRNLLIAGTTGCGKTHAAYAVGFALLDLGCSPYAATAPDLLDSFRPKADPREQAWVLDSDVLIVDDFGTEKQSDFVDETWWRIIDYRYKTKRPIVLTTNLSYDEMKAMYGSRVMSRLLSDLPLILKMTGPDRRAKF